MSPGMTWGSICTGSGMDLWIAKAFEDGFKACGLDFKVTHSYEIEPQKRAWVMRSLQLAGHNDTCVFGDCQDLPKGLINK
eukprot:6526680-Karenia_brevis.AAC.1